VDQDRAGNRRLKDKSDGRRSPDDPGPRIETERLILRLYRASDYDAVHALSAPPDMWRYSERGGMTPEESWARLLRHTGHWTVMGFGIFGVEEKLTGRLVGEAGHADFRRHLGGDFDSFPEASWTIDPHAQGRGYATEAARAAAAWIERARGATTTVCLVHEENAPSLRVAEKLGYRPMRSFTYRGYPATLMKREQGRGI
jgi:RimJ/RimL family protein N-acetyltransferase